MQNNTSTKQHRSAPTQGLKAKVFGKNGMLHRAVGKGYELREGQMRMAVEVARAIIGWNILLCEGATGIGKSFGYLIPAFSTNTHNNQIGV